MALGGSFPTTVSMTEYGDDYHENLSALHSTATMAMHHCEISPGNAAASIDDVDSSLISSPQCHHFSPVRSFFISIALK